jgi:hypothetical protein
MRIWANRALSGLFDAKSLKGGASVAYTGLQVSSAATSCKSSRKSEMAGLGGPGMPEGKIAGFKSRLSPRA